MKKYKIVKKTIGFMMILMLISLCPVQGFSQNNLQNKQQQPQENHQPLTSDQKALIKKILSQYNASKLTAKDAQAIHEKFREAGIHGGPETKEAIIAAGFDPEKLKNLAPPPNDKGRQNPPTLDEKLKLVEEKIIKPLSLNENQRKTVIAAYKEFYTAVEKLMKSQADPKVRLDKSKVEPLEKTRDEKIQQILSKDQFVKYMELEKATRPPHDKGDKQN